MRVRRWQALLAALMLAALAFALRPLAPGQGPENWFPHADKAHHLWFFALLWSIGLRAGIAPGLRWALALLAFGAAIEVAQQALSATRAASLGDLGADVLGIAAGWGLGVALGRRGSGGQPQEHRR